MKLSALVLQNQIVRAESASVLVNKPAVLDHVRRVLLYSFAEFYVCYIGVHKLLLTWQLEFLVSTATTRAVQPPAHAHQTCHITSHHTNIGRLYFIFTLIILFAIILHYQIHLLLIYIIFSSDADLPNCLKGTVH